MWRVSSKCVWEDWEEDDERQVCESECEWRFSTSEFTFAWFEPLLSDHLDQLLVWFLIRNWSGVESYPAFQSSSERNEAVEVGWMDVAMYVWHDLKLTTTQADLRSQLSPSHLSQIQTSQWEYSHRLDELSKALISMYWKCKSWWCSCEQR